MTFETLQQFISAHWVWAATAAGGFGILTKLADKLLKSSPKETIALWLMGAETEENWARSFCKLFDSIFGEIHRSLRCILMSFAFSLIAVVGIWALLSSVELLQIRANAALDLGQVLLIGLAINLLADYISLLETRLLLNLLHKHRTWAEQIGVLLLDLILSAAIIYVAIWLYLRSPLYEGDPLEFAEVLGAFSIFSVFFYSTFLTSVWTWGYVLSAWFMRLFAYTPLRHAIDAKNAMNWLAVTGGLCLGATAFALAIPFQARVGGVSYADRMLCSVFPGRVCNRVAALTTDERVQFDFLMKACSGGVTEQCLEEGRSIRDVDNLKAVSLFSASCDGGDMQGCVYLGFMYEKGLGVALNPNRSFSLYEKACAARNALGCTNLGSMYRTSLVVNRNPALAVSYYRQGCKYGSAEGCTNLGYMYRKGVGVDSDQTRAAQLYEQGCDQGDASGCYNLGYMYENGEGVSPNLARAMELHGQGCEMMSAKACNSLGWIYTLGKFEKQNTKLAIGFFGKACELRHLDSCHMLHNLTD